MNRPKFLVGVFLVGTMAATSFSTESAASERSEPVEVTYDSRKEIPDPDHPDNPNWVVKIPSEIRFTDNNRIIDASVELVPAGTETVIGDHVRVAVAVDSENMFKLKHADKTDEISYKLRYSETVLTDQTTVIGELNKQTRKMEGQAVLGNDTAKYRGTYSDKLTYYIGPATKPIS